MRNPRILNLSILFIIFNLNLITQVLPSPLYTTDLKISTDNSVSWVRLIDPGGQIFKPSMKWVNKNIYFGGQWGNSYSYDNAIYLAKYSNNGTKLWEKKWDTPLNDELFGFEFDSLENIYLLCTQGRWSYEQLVSIILLKYSYSGELLWAKTLNTSSSCAAYAIKLDQDDNIYVVGGAMKDDTFQKFLFKLNSNGDIIWKNRINLYPQHLEVDLNNKVYICGDYSNGTTALYKYNNTGSIIWSLQLAQYYDVSSMIFDSNHNILLNGETPDFYNDTNTLRIWKYNNSGILMNKLEFIMLDYNWQHNGRAWLIEDDLYIFIIYPESLNSDSLNYYLLKYNYTFHLDWNVSLNDFFFLYNYDSLDFVIDVDTYDNITFCYTNPKSEYTRESGLTPSNTLDISILKLDSSGEIFSHYYWGGTYRDRPLQIFIDPMNDVYLLCTCRYIDNWNFQENKIVLLKNPEINGTPPRLGVKFGFYDYYIFSFLGFMSIISIMLLISIINTTRRRKDRSKNYQSN